jgi:23S rRNA pseudouridine1911/1915/1917 synthase
MVIHPATGNETHTLMNAVTYYLKDVVEEGEESRSGLIHRIDKDTSGLVLIGKTNEALWYYSRLFAERKVTKIYIAISAGNFKDILHDDVYLVKNFLGRNPGNRKKYSKVSPSKGKIAETNFKLIAQGKLDNEEFSIIEAYPKTGRTHQIRVHLSSLGLPIWGDVIYGKKNHYSRLLLHAWKLSIQLLNGKEVVFEAPIPEEFKVFYH